MADDATTLEQDATLPGTLTDENKPPKLKQAVEIKDAGPCRKHIKVAIDREDIESRLDQKFSELMKDAQVPGFRPGKVPRKLVEKQFFKDVADRLKAELLLQSLEELAEEHKINPIAQPNIDPFKIDIPKAGPLEYEFEVEVAPDFELPNYKGLQLKRPVKQITDAEVETTQKRFLRNYGHLHTKEGGAEADDVLIADVHIKDGDREMSKFDTLSIRVEPQLAFKDGLVKDFADKVQGVKAGESRTVDVQLSPALNDPNLRGKTVQATFHVKEVKHVHLPELNEEFLGRLGLQSADQIKDQIRDVLQKQMEYEQRQAVRRQVLGTITSAGQWDLPRDLLQRQARKTLQKRILEMQQAGFTEEQISSRIQLLQQDALASTAQALKEHFVLQRIAETEKLEVGQDDVELEIERIAMQSDESPRRVRARIEKEELMETLMTQILERKALDLVLDSATYEDVPFEGEVQTTAVEAQAAPAAEEPPSDQPTVNNPS